MSTGGLINGTFPKKYLVDTRRGLDNYCSLDLGECSAKFVRQACLAMLGGIIGVVIQSQYILIQSVQNYNETSEFNQNATHD